MPEFKLGLSGGAAISADAGDKINIISFLSELSPAQTGEYKILSAYGMYMVTSGSASLNMINNRYFVKEGDLFFTFPTKSFYISDMDKFQYIQILFFGGRGAKLISKSGISADNPIVPDKGELKDLWERCHQMQNGSNTELLAESLVLMTMANISVLQAQSQKYASTSMESVRQYIDTHYNDASISLQSVSAKFGYNFHYVSRSFKEKFGKSFSEYLTFIRIHKACELMDEGLSNISNISNFIGYSDPLYFSRVFSKEIGSSPKQYVQALKKKRQNQG